MKLQVTIAVALVSSLIQVDALNYNSQDIVHGWVRLNPVNNYTACGLTTPGYLCDDGKQLLPSDRRRINKVLEAYNNNTCGHCMAVYFANITSLEPMSAINISAAAVGQPTSLTRRSTVRYPLVSRSSDGQGWEFEGCRSLAVLVLVPHAGAWGFATGVGGISCDTWKRTKPGYYQDFFVREDYPGVILQVIERFERDLTAKYETMEHCETVNVCVPLATREDVTTHLPSPYIAGNWTKCNGAGPLCDPDKFFSREERRRLTGVLEATAGTQCKACLAVGVVTKLRAKEKDLEAVAKTILSTWIPPYVCRSMSILLVVPHVERASQFALLLPKNGVPACSKLVDVYDSNAVHFRAGNVKAGIMGIANGYLSTMKGVDNCRSDICGDSKYNDCSAASVCMPALRGIIFL